MRLRHALLAASVALGLWAGCSDGPSGSGGEGGTATGTGIMAGGGAAAPFECIEIASFTPAAEDFPPCDVASQADCLCEGCTDDGTCFNAAASLVDDCVCADCVADPFCTNPDNCTNDGVCSPYVESCQCQDCQSHPECL